MARVSSNGWPILDQYTGAQFVAIDEGGAHDVVNDDAAQVFAWLVYRLGTEVLAGHGGVVSCSGARTWGEQMRTNPGVKFSNHLSGTAIDLADNRVHPYEPRLNSAPYSSGYTDGEAAAIDAIVADFDGIMQWGHHFPSPYRDPVHFQLTQDLNFLNAGPQVVTPARLHAVAVKVDKLVRAIQSAVGATVDGYAGPGMLAKVKAFQQAHGLNQDGIWGPRSQAAAGKPPVKQPGRSHGNDVSNHQSVAQWRRLNPQFLIAKSAEGLSWRDPAYRAHMAAARGLNLPGGQGAYIYVWPEYDAKAVCRNFLQISGLQPGEWGVIDFEPYSSKSDPKSWPAWVVTFALEYRKSRGEWPWLYVNDDMATRLLSRANPAQAKIIRQLPLWKAAYGADPGSLHGWPRLEAWQYTGTGVDANWRYTSDQPTPTRPTPPKRKPDPKVARIQRIVGAHDDGIYGAVTASKVKAFQGRLRFVGHRIAQDGIYGPATEAARRDFCDGVLGPRTIRLWQHNAGTHVDGAISRRSALIRKVQRVDSKSPAVQRRNRAKADGRLGPKTWRMLQDLMGIHVDGIPGHQTITHLQARLLRGRW